MLRSLRIGWKRKGRNNMRESLPNLNVILVKPSKYDDDGYVIHHVRGVLPSNTLNALNGLIRDTAQRMGVSVEVHLIDETVQLVVPERVMRKWGVPGVPTLVALVGVQTNQFPRAADLAVRFRRLGAMVVMGGFHVSGSLALLGLTPELQQLREQGISLFAGEAEGRLEELLSDALKGKLKSVYWMGDLPDLTKEWAPPLVEESVAKRFVLPYAGTMDTSRGCVFKCSFCTIIHVQGNFMRYRSPELIEKHVREHYPRIKHYFFTDDNMSRNPQWREIFERLIRMREQEGIRITFMMQVDVPSYRIPDFVELAAKAGCSQVFIGLESLNADNLKAASKGQNKTNFYQEMIQAWHRYGIAVHTSYIIGFPFDTVESVRRDITTLMEEVQPDQASFFMLTPLPGSMDHLEMTRRGEWMSPDFNEYDSFHAAQNHPNMTKEEWFNVYREAWKRFYSVENLTKVLHRASPESYWGIFKNAVWYAYATHCEEAHPMITGFWRLKGRTERRPTFPMESRLAYAWRRTKDSVVLAWRVLKLILMFEKIWRATWLTKRAAEWRESVAQAKEAQVQRQRRALAKVVAFLTYLHLRMGQSRAVWQDAWQLLKRGKVWHPRLYLGSLYGAFLSLSELLTRGWLFLMNFALET
ncbi:MAG: radical SAM protein [Armatimonadota bacterium]|nr:radical SAM protein [Armatimonadota bacterium]